MSEKFDCIAFQGMHRCGYWSSEVGSEIKLPLYLQRPTKALRSTPPTPFPERGDKCARPFLVGVWHAPAVQTRRDLRQYSASPASNAPERIVRGHMSTSHMCMNWGSAVEKTFGHLIVLIRRSYILIPRIPYLRLLFF